MQLRVISRDVYGRKLRLSLAHDTEINFFKFPGVVFPGVLVDGLITGVLTQAAALLWIVEQFQNGFGKYVDLAGLNQQAIETVLNYF